MWFCPARQPASSTKRQSASIRRIPVIRFHIHRTAYTGVVLLSFSSPLAPPNKNRTLGRSLEKPRFTSSFFRSARALASSGLVQHLPGCWRLGLLGVPLWPRSSSSVLIYGAKLALCAGRWKGTLRWMPVTREAARGFGEATLRRRKQRTAAVVLSRTKGLSIRPTKTHAGGCQTTCPPRKLRQTSDFRVNVPPTSQANSVACQLAGHAWGLKLCSLISVPPIPKIRGTYFRQEIRQCLPDEVCF